MATIKEIIYTIRALRYDSHTPDDFAISDARLQHFVDVERSFLLKQYLDKDRIVPKQVEQVIECLRGQSIHERTNNTVFWFLFLCFILSGCNSPLFFFFDLQRVTK